MRLTCENCERKIIVVSFKLGRVISPGIDHDLCQQCWKRERDRSWAVEMKRVIGKRLDELARNHWQRFGR